MITPDGYILLSLEEYSEKIATHEKAAMKIAIKALVSDIISSFNKSLIDLMTYHNDGVDKCNVDRVDIILNDLIKNNLSEKPTNLHS